MNAFTIPKKSIAQSFPKPRKINEDSIKHWRNLPVTGAKQGEIERNNRAKLARSAI